MSHELMLVLVVLTSAAVTAGWLVLAGKRHWFDHPNSRSSHLIPTPSSGGVAIFAAFALFAVFESDTVRTWQGALAAAAACMLAITGLADDFFKLGIKLRVALQVLAVAALWPLLVAMPLWPVVAGLSLTGYLLALVLGCAVLWLINLYNFMDGIDGLAAMEAIFFGLALAALTVIKGLPLLDLMPLGLVAAVAGFLLFNLAPARLFMGGVGSYFLGYLLAVISLQQIQAGTISYWGVAILLGVFIVDSTTTLSGRLLTGAMWYHPHRSHAYQLLARRWSSHGRVVAAYAAVNVLWLLPLAWLAELYPYYGIWLLLVAWLPLVVAVHRIRSGLSVSS